MGVHDTQHYPAIKQLLGIPEDEPIFILRAKDRAAMETIKEYGCIADDYGASEEFSKGVDKCIDEFRAFRANNRGLMKVPD